MRFTVYLIHIPRKPTWLFPRLVLHIPDDVGQGYPIFVRNTWFARRERQVIGRPLAFVALNHIAVSLHSQEIERLPEKTSALTNAIFSLSLIRDCVLKSFLCRLQTPAMDQWLLPIAITYVFMYLSWPHSLYQFSYMVGALPGLEVTMPSDDAHQKHSTAKIQRAALQCYLLVHVKLSHVWSMRMAMKYIKLSHI